MTWLRVDDKIHDHPKVRRLGRDRLPAMGLWLVCGSWCADNLTDGFVPNEVVARVDPKHRYATRLVEVDLWHRSHRQGEDGFVYHEWEQHQPSRSEVLQQRSARAEAGRRGGLKSGETRRAKGAAREANDEASASRLLAKQNEANVNPDPTRVEPSLTLGSTNGSLTRADPRRT